jgi:hypothetical protein
MSCSFPFLHGFSPLTRKSWDKAIGDINALKVETKELRRRSGG